MPDTPRDSDVAELPEAVAVPRRRWRLQVIWLIPLVAALIGAWLAINAILERGPTVTVTFKTAEGLEAGKTKLKYKDVEIGVVKSITLSKDLSKVVATAELVKDFTPHLVDDTRFWIVRPRISGGTVSGLSTLLSGSYIGVDVGRSSTTRRDYTGLEVPPVVQLDMPGREFTLHSDNVGSFDAGVPVFFRQLPVGQVVSYNLEPNGKGVSIKVFINDPYTRFVNANTRFWNASGIKVRMDANGIRMDTQSLASIVVGGIAFDNPPAENGSTAAPVSQKTSFMLYADREDAMKNPETETMKMVMVFEDSVRGLSVGAPVDFRGIGVGEVSAINLYVDPATRKIVMPVEVNLYPDRLRMRERAQQARGQEQRKELLDAMVAHGMRAQLRNGNLLTGQLYVAIDYMPNAPKAKMNWEAYPPQMPTSKGNLQEIQNALASIAGKLDKLPIEQIGTDVRTTLKTASALLQRLDVEVAPEMRGAVTDARKALDSANRMMAPGAGMQQDARETMREMTRAANAFRILADYLQRHPEALIRGKKED